MCLLLDEGRPQQYGKKLYHVSEVSYLLMLIITVDIVYWPGEKCCNQSLYFEFNHFIKSHSLC